MILDCFDHSAEVYYFLKKAVFVVKCREFIVTKNMNFLVNMVSKQELKVGQSPRIYCFVEKVL